MKTESSVPKDFKTKYYAVATDKSMSGWGEARGGMSYFAVACQSAEEARDAIRRMDRRSEFIRVRFNFHPPKGGPRDHLSIISFEQFTYQP